MTAASQPESKSPSRRALLAGALGGLGAMAAGTIGRTSPVRAATGDPVTVDGTFTGSGITQITTSGTSGFRGVSSHSGASAILGQATAVSGGATGVRGETSSTTGTGVTGTAAASSGANYGVWGYTNSTAGTGVIALAVASSGTTFGVYAQSNSPNGVGVYAANGVAGVALKTAGRATFSTSGVATITAGSTSRTVTPGVSVTSGSFVLLTPKVKISGRDLWFTTDTTNDRFTIHMSSSRSSGTKVAWLLLG
jgi:hypothetical protein